VPMPVHPLQSQSLTEAQQARLTIVRLALPPQKEVYHFVESRNDGHFALLMTVFAVLVLNGVLWF
jgi:hypothetical protein